MPSTSRGYPYPQIADDNNPPADIQALADAVNADIDGTAWVAPTLGSSWVSFDGGATFAVPSYCLKAGEVILKGAMKSGTTGTVFTLPAGMRPLKMTSFLVVGDGGSQTAQVRIAANGAVTVPFFGTGSANTFVSLDGIRFLAEQ